MKYNKIVLAGGSGYIGRVLARNFRDRCKQIIILSRKARPQAGNITTIVWDGKNPGNWQYEIDGADILINLTGKSVDCRYNKRNRTEILNSRIDAITALNKAVNQLAIKPRLFLNISSATIYRHAEDHAQDEQHGEYGEGFSVDVCTAWENAFFEQNAPVRKATLRMAIVLGAKAGALPQYIKLTRMGFGGIQGNGKQMFSWIHEDEISDMTDFLYARNDLSGVFNASSPNPVNNKMLMQLLRQKLKVSFGIPTSKWMIEIGTALAGTEAELVLKSRWVLPQRLLQEGYVFQHPNLDEALNTII